MIGRNAESQGTHTSAVMKRWRHDWSARRSRLAESLQEAADPTTVFATVDFSVSSNHTKYMARKAVGRYRGLAHAGEITCEDASTLTWKGPRSYAGSVIDALWNSSRFINFEIYTQARIHSSPNSAPRGNFDAELDMFGVVAQAPGFDGSGVKVTVADTGVDLTHCRYQTRTTACSSVSSVPSSAAVDMQVLKFSYTDCEDTDGHGTHVVGSVRDLAPGAQTVLVDTQHSSSSTGYLSFTVSGIFSVPLQLGSRIFSFSFSDSQTNYGVLSSSIDSRIVTHDVLVLVAAGNDGSTMAQCGGGQLGNPSNGLNVVTVGALASGYSFFDNGGLHSSCGSTTDSCATGYRTYWKSAGTPWTKPSDGSWGSWNHPRPAAWFSSEGPTLSGGRGADVAAPGMLVMSDFSNKDRAPGTACDATEQFDSLQGTSMATPLVAGVAARIYELFGRVLAQPSNNCTVGCVIDESVRSTAESATGGSLATVSGTLLRAALALCGGGTSSSVAYPTIYSGRKRLYVFQGACDTAARRGGFGQLDPGRLLGQYSGSHWVAVTNRQFTAVTTLATVPTGHQLCFRATGPAAINSSVAWNDPGNIDGTPQHTFVLTVSAQGQTALTSSGSTADTLQRVDWQLASAPAGFVDVSVSARLIDTPSPEFGPVKYSILAHVQGATLLSAASDFCSSCHAQPMVCADSTGSGMRFCGGDACEYLTCNGLDSSGSVVSTQSSLCLNSPGSCWGVRHAVDGQCVQIACTESAPTCPAGSAASCVRAPFSSTGFWGHCTVQEVSGTGSQADEDYTAVIVGATAVAGVAVFVVALFH